MGQYFLPANLLDLEYFLDQQVFRIQQTDRRLDGAKQADEPIGRDELLLFIEEAIQWKTIGCSSSASDSVVSTRENFINNFNHQILHVYMYGSRVYFHEESDHQLLGLNRDYDTVVIVQNDIFTKLIENSNHHDNSFLHHHSEESIKPELFVLNSNKQYYKILYTFVRNNVEISMSIYSERIFQRMVQDHSIFILFCLHNRNPIVKLKESWNENVEGYTLNDVSLSQCYYRKYFQKHKFVPSVLSEVNRAWQKFYNKIVKDHDESKGTKLVAYCFRFLAWAEELLHRHCVDESVFSGNEIYWNLHQNLLDKFDKHDYKALYKTIFEEYGEKYNVTVDSFTKKSEFSYLYPSISLTKSETTEVVISEHSAILKEMKELLEGLNSIEDVYRLFSIDYISSESCCGIALSATDMSPRDYPITSLCINSSLNNSLLIDAKQHSILKSIPFIPNIRIEMNESACREVILKNGLGSTFHEVYAFRNQEKCFNIWWNFQVSQWDLNTSTNSPPSLCFFLTCLPNLLNTDHLESYSIIVQSENENDIDLIGFTCLEKSGKFSQKLVTKFVDFAPHLLMSMENFNNFSIAFREPILKIEQSNVLCTFDGYRTFVLNHDQIQNVLHDNQVEAIEIITQTDECTEPFYTFISTPSFNCLRKMKQIILENGDCSLKDVNQLPKHIKDLCLEFARWELNVDELLTNNIKFYGNTVEMILEQIEKYRLSISNLVETLKRLSTFEVSLLDKQLKQITTNKQAISLLKAILFKIQQKSSIDNIIDRCIRNTYRQRLLMLLEEVSK